MAAQAQTASGNIAAVPEKRLENSGLRTASDTIHAITESTKQVFAASERLAQDLEELSGRICEGADFRAQIAKRPWLVAALTLAGGAVVWNAFNRRRRVSASH
ncbi:MAG TPA: hypothetical protein VHZ07_27210 [Bryobacteraceae bacterium]|jgi:hypothetical protein|nr:hypothetical protein [Bryobacteraceae bacterium]